MTGLTEDVTQVLEPVRQIAERLSAAERDAIEQALQAAREICEDEERQACAVVDEFNKLQDEMEDK
jgi:hypothetical protein